MKSQTYDALVIPFVLSDPIPVSGLKKTGNLEGVCYCAGGVVRMLNFNFSGLNLSFEFELSKSIDGKVL